MLNFSYILFMLPALILGLVAQLIVKSRYKKYSAIPNKSRLTGADAANLVLSSNGVRIAGIGHVQGEMTDYYDPKNNIICLSDGVYGEPTIASVGIAAHEAGHALQYADNYFPIKLRSAIVPVCNFGSSAGIILIIVGFFLSYIADWLIGLGNLVYLIGVVLFSAVALFRLVTLPVELNASRRAINALRASNALEADELKGAEKVLKAAALTYVAALLTAVLQVFYYASRFKPRK